MKGFIPKTLAALLVGGGVTACGGCFTYRDLVDPCYPQRYEYAARQEVQASFDPQVANGHVLDQTLWNWYFEAGTDRLNPAGMAQLVYIGRRRPTPDPVVWLATAHDLAYDPAHPGEFVKARADLDQRRITAVQKFLNAQTAGRPVAFDVRIHDPAEPDISAVEANIAVQQMYTGARGNLPVTVGAGATGGAGAAPGGPR